MQKETEIAELAELAIPDEDKPEFVAFLQRPKHQIIPILDGDSPKFKIKIKVQGTVLEMKKPLSEEGIEKQAEKAIKHDIMETYKEALKLHADVFEFSQTLYRMNPRAWEKTAVKNELPLSPDSLESVEVEVKITSGGKLKLKQK